MIMMSMALASGKIVQDDALKSNKELVSTKDLAKPSPASSNGNILKGQSAPIQSVGGPATIRPAVTMSVSGSTISGPSTTTTMKSAGSGSQATVKPVQEVKVTTVSKPVEEVKTVSTITVDDKKGNGKNNNAAEEKKESVSAAKNNLVKEESTSKQNSKAEQKGAEVVTSSGTVDLEKELIRAN